MDHAAGVVCLVRPGESVVAGQPLFELHTNRPESLRPAAEVLAGGWEIGETVPQPADLVLDVLRGPR